MGGYAERREADVGIMDEANKLKDKATEAASDDATVDKVADKADEATGGKFSDQIDKGAEKAKEKNDNLGE
jgi:hypothetical protein